MHKRTTPKTFARAKELHLNMSPAEAELWKRLRAHRMGDVHSRNQDVIENYIVDVPWHRPPGRCVHLVRNSLSNWMESLRSQHLEQAEYDTLRVQCDERTK